MDYKELKESKDERIRKEITEFILWALDRGSITECQRGKSNSWIAWLEKQGEQKHQFKPFDRVLVRDSNEDKWMCDIFSHYDADADEYVYLCVSAAWKQCIPFEGNEQLVGTANEPKGGKE